MKKLMTIAFAIAMAGATHAGAVMWNALNIQASPATTDKSAATYCGYLFTGSDYTAATQYLLEGTLDLDAFKSAAIGTKTTTYVANNDMLNIVGGQSGSFVSESVTAYLVIVDAATVDAASNYLVAKVNGTGSEYITQAFGTSGNKTFSFGAQAANTGWQAIAVPEPTSGLMLLLGVAGLALRRRRV